MDDACLNDKEWAIWQKVSCSLKSIPTFSSRIDTPAFASYKRKINTRLCDRASQKRRKSKSCITSLMVSQPTTLLPEPCGITATDKQTDGRLGPNRPTTTMTTPKKKAGETMKLTHTVYLIPTQAISTLTPMDVRTLTWSERTGPRSRFLRWMRTVLHRLKEQRLPLDPR